MEQKYFVNLAVVLLCMLLTAFVNGIPLNDTEDAHNIRECTQPELNAPTPLCDLIYYQSGFPFSWQTVTITCPQTGTNDYRLNCIIVTNLDDDDNGGYASIVAGGIQDYYVDIYLKSQWGKGLNFHVEVYTVNPSSTASTTVTKPR